MEWNVEFTLGALLIIVYAHGRYNQPVHHRSSTTAARYFGSLIAYYAVGLGLYYLFSRYPHLLQSLLADQPEDIRKYAEGLENVSAPLFVAVLLTVFLANVPGIAKLDQWVRERLQYMAAIPYEVRRMSAELHDTPPPFVVFEDDVEGAGVTMLEHMPEGGDKERFREMLFSEEDLEPEEACFFGQSILQGAIRAFVDVGDEHALRLLGWAQGVPATPR